MRLLSKICICGTFFLYACINIIETCYKENIVLLFSISIVLVLMLLALGISTHTVVGRDYKKITLSILLFLLALLSTILFSTSWFQAVKNIIVLLLPLLALNIFWLIKFKRDLYAKILKWCILLVASFYSLLALITWFTGRVYSTQGFSSNISGWYIGVAIFIAYLCFLASIYLVQEKRVIIPCGLMVIFIFIQLLSGSKQGIILFVIFSIISIVGMLIQQFITKSAKFNICFYLLLLVSILAAPIALEYSRINNSVDYPIPLPEENQLKEENIDWYQCINSNDYIGYITYQDINSIESLSKTNRFNNVIFSNVMNDFIKSRLHTDKDDLLNTSLKENQFLSASNGQAGFWQKILGYGPEWFSGYSSSLKNNGYLFLFNCYGILGILVFITPIILILISIIKKGQWAKFKLYLCLESIGCITGFIYILWLIHYCGGVILHPVMLIFIYIPLILVYKKILIVNEDIHVSAKKNEKKYSLLTKSISILVSIIIIVLCATGTIKAKTIYSLMYKNHTGILEDFNYLRPGFLQTLTESNDPPMPKSDDMQEFSPAEAFLNGDYLGYHFGNGINWNLPGISDPSI